MKASKLRAQQRRQKKRSRASGKTKKAYVPKVHWSGMTLSSQMIADMKAKALRVQLLVEEHLRTGMTWEQMLEVSDYLNLLYVSAVHRADSFDQEAYEEYCSIFVPSTQAIQSAIDRGRKLQADVHFKKRFYVFTGPEQQAIFAVMHAAGDFVDETIATCPMKFIHEAMALPKLFDMQERHGTQITAKVIDAAIAEVMRRKGLLEAVGLVTATEET